jgi:hypothetical protein
MVDAHGPVVIVVEPRLAEAALWNEFADAAGDPRAKRAGASLTTLRRLLSRSHAESAVFTHAISTNW